MRKIVSEIRIWPDKILRKKCKKVENFFLAREIFDKMYKIVKESDSKVLAANQIGLDISCLIVRAEDKVFYLVNPSLIKKEGYQVKKESCLSLPHLGLLEIKRARSVWVEYWNEKGEKLCIEAEDDLASILQHGIDHLQGKLFIDRVSLRRKLSLLKKLNYGVS